MNGIDRVDCEAEPLRLRGCGGQHATCNVQHGAKRLSVLTAFRAEPLRPKTGTDSAYPSSNCTRTRHPRHICTGWVGCCRMPLRSSRLWRTSQGNGCLKANAGGPSAPPSAQASLAPSHRRPRACARAFGCTCMRARLVVPHCMPIYLRRLSGPVGGRAVVGFLSCPNFGESAVTPGAEGVVGSVSASASAPPSTLCERLRADIRPGRTARTNADITCQRNMQHILLLHD